MLRRCLITHLELLSVLPSMDPVTPRGARRLITAIRKTMRPGDAAYKQYERTFLWIGSHIVLATPLDSASNSEVPVGLLFHEISMLLRGQAQLSVNGVSLGGLMTIGDVAAGIDWVLGPGRQAAAEMHSHLGRYPRIIVDPAVLRALEIDPLLRKDTHSVQQEQVQIKGMLRESMEGLWYVDYLGGMRSEVSHTNYMDYLRDHRDAVSAQFENVKILDDSACRLQWLAAYHNRAVKKLATEASDGDVRKQVRALTIATRPMTEYDFPKQPKVPRARRRPSRPGRGS